MKYENDFLIHKWWNERDQIKFFIWPALHSEVNKKI